MAKGSGTTKSGSKSNPKGLQNGQIGNINASANYVYKENTVKPKLDARNIESEYKSIIGGIGIEASISNERVHITSFIGSKANIKTYYAEIKRGNTNNYYLDAPLGPADKTKDFTSRAEEVAEKIFKKYPNVKVVSISKEY